MLPPSSIAAAILPKQRNRDPDHPDRDRRQSSAEDRHEKHECEVIHSPGMADSILTQIEREVGSWDGVTVSAHRFGGVEILPASGWVSYRIGSERDIPSVIGLFRLNYERPWKET
jgi:hypothetical protein